MDGLTIVMSAAVVIAVGLYFHRAIQRAENPTHLPPRSMTVDQFYEQNPLRRSSAEIDLGDGWRAAEEAGCTFSVFWLEQTGEVYALRVPNPYTIVTGGAGDHGLGGSSLGPATVEILGQARTREELDQRLVGWELKISDSNGVDWIRSQLSAL